LAKSIVGRTKLWHLGASQVFKATEWARALSCVDVS
jgi:hypothetical protein